ncbi:MAG: GTP-binding protein [bacterium]|nr:GTP-binding protein [bacterium]
MTDLSPTRGLTNLTLLDARHNAVTRLPEALLQLNMTFDVDKDTFNPGVCTLYGNPLETPPPEIIRKGKKAIKNYYQSLKKTTLRPLNEVKVLLVGDGGAGKTSLVKHILHAPFDPGEKQTEGISIQKWQCNAIQVRLWDFGGQEILHATHQFFLSKRSLYILVLDGRKDEKTEYWLKQIKSFGQNSPVLVVMNKIDQHPRFDVNRSFLQHKYPNIIGFHRLSCLDNTGIHSFVETLTTSLDKVQIKGTTWSEKWFRIKTELETMSDHYITYDRYRRMCKEAGIDDESARETLEDFLNDLGVVLHFKDLHLTGTHVLNPGWVTNAVYKIINGKEQGATDGVLPVSALETILGPCKSNTYCYPKETHGFILGLMGKFELCYGVDKEKILIPDLLQENEKTAALEGELLIFLFRYDFFPRSILPRFIVRLHKDIKAGLRWRTGVVLQNVAYGDTTALVKADEKDGTITVWVEGELKRDYFQVIRNTLNEIHAGFDKLDVKELIPLPDAPGHTVSYSNLMGYEVSGKREYFSGDLRRDFNVAQLLNGVVSQEQRLQEYQKSGGREDYQKLPGNNGGDTYLVIDNSNTNLLAQQTAVSQEVNQNVRQNVDIDIDISFDLKMELPDLQSQFDDLRHMLAAGFPELGERLKEVDAELYDIDEKAKPKQLKRPLSKLGNLLRKLGKGNEKYQELLDKGGKAVENAQALGRTYNKFAQWVPALPVIPDVFLGKD